MGIDVDFVDFNDHQAVLSKMLTAEGKTKLVWLETPTNPTLKVTDIEKVSTITKRFDANALLAVDNTICSPYFQNPLEHGADIVVHSVTKYINGHSDVVMVRRRTLIRFSDICQNAHRSSFLRAWCAPTARTFTSSCDSRRTAWARSQTRSTATWRTEA